MRSFFVEVKTSTYAISFALSVIQIGIALDNIVRHKWVWFWGILLIGFAISAGHTGNILYQRLNKNSNKDKK